MRKVFDILIADDDPEDIELFEEAILKLEPRVKLHKFFSGNSIIEYLHSSEDDRLPCLIILDYNMPELKGSHVLALLKSKKRYESIPKVVVSTSNADLHENECISQGATGYLVKPFNIEELENLAKKLMAYCKAGC